MTNDDTEAPFECGIDEARNQNDPAVARTMMRTQLPRVRIQGENQEIKLSLLSGVE